MTFEVELITRLGKTLGNEIGKISLVRKGSVFSPNTEPNLEGMVALVWPQNRWHEGCGHRLLPRCLGGGYGKSVRVGRKDSGRKPNANALVHYF